MAKMLYNNVVLTTLDPYIIECSDVRSVYVQKILYLYT